MEIYSNRLDIISLLCLLVVATAKADGLGLAGLTLILLTPQAWAVCTYGLKKLYVLHKERIHVHHNIKT